MLLFWVVPCFKYFSRLDLSVVLCSHDLNSLGQILNKLFSSCGANNAVTQSLRCFGSRLLNIDYTVLGMLRLSLPALGTPVFNSTAPRTPILGLTALGARLGAPATRPRVVQNILEPFLIWRAASALRALAAPAARSKRCGARGARVGLERSGIRKF